MTPLEGLTVEDEGLLAAALDSLLQDPGCRRVGLELSPAYAARWDLIAMARAV